MINLTDLKPESGKFNLEDKSYVIRPMTLSDEIWLRKEFNKEAFDEFIKGNPDFEIIARIVYHQLVDKSDFVPQEIVDHDENGEPIIAKCGGWKLLSSKMIGHEVKIEMINALNTAMGISKDMVDKITQEKKSLI